MKYIRRQSETDVRQDNRGIYACGVPARWPGYVLRLIAVVGLGAGVYYISPSINISDAVDRPIASVSVAGDFHFVSRERITTLVTPLINKKFLQLNLDGIRQSIEREAYVDYATLNRRWPDRLMVRIVEQQPIARWGESGFLNQRGEVVDTDQLTSVRDLPLLLGDRMRANNIMLQYQRISQLLHPQGLEVAELKNNTATSWQLVLTNGLRIIIGRDEIMEKMQRFLVVYKDQLQFKLDEIALVDVRYKNGVAVSWHDRPSGIDAFASVN